MPRRDCRAHTWPQEVSRLLIPVGCALMGGMRAIKRPGAAATAALIVATTAVAVMKNSDWPHADWWGPGSVGRTVFVVLSILTASASFLVSLSLSRTLARQRMHETFVTAAHGFSEVAETKTRLRHTQIGVNIWLVRGPVGFRRLVREASATRPRTTTPIVWTKDKGVIGQAWSRKKTRFANLEEFRTLASTKSVFCQLPPEDRFRLTWEQFEETRRYQAVLAVPLRRERFARHSVRGVVAIDLLGKGKAELLKGLQDSKEFDSIRLTCEATLSKRQLT
jgi:hypothetical protein